MKLNIKFLMIIPALLSFGIVHSQKWVLPPNAAKTTNPYSGDKSLMDAAKVTYKATCAPCHGEKGKGDGPAAAALNPKPADHTSKVVQVETDGTIFWKITNGDGGGMQPYKTQLTDKQRWALVNYIRTFKK